MVKNVPANATAVGIPAHILEEEKNQPKVEANQKTSFAAYAVGDDKNDILNPEALIKAMHSLLEQSCKQETELQALKDQLAQLELKQKTDAQSNLDLAAAFASKKPPTQP